MSDDFKKMLQVSKPYFFLRLAVSLFIVSLYLLVASMVQYGFIYLLEESTFNYLVGGLCSLILSVCVVYWVDKVLMMFIHALHMSALSYTDSIIKHNLSAYDVGMRAFKSNFLTFGAVYAVRTFTYHTLSTLTKKFWELFGDNKIAQYLSSKTQHPVVQYISKDLLHYSFDCIIFYIVGSKEEKEDVMTTALMGLKKYLYCLSSMVLSSIQTYILFKFLPVLCALILLFIMLFTEGLVTAVLFSVLLFPIFYLLNNIFFDSLIMLVFLSKYKTSCETENYPEDIVSKVEGMLSEESLDTSTVEQEAPIAESKEEVKEEKPIVEATQKQDESTPKVTPKEDEEDLTSFEFVEGDFPEENTIEEDSEDDEITKIVSSSDLQNPIPIDKLQELANLVSKGNYDLDYDPLKEEKENEKFIEE